MESNELLAAMIEEEEEEEEEPLLIYTAQGSSFRCEKLPVIKGALSKITYKNYTL